MDAQKQLPVRSSTFVKDQTGETREVQREEFTEWRLNEPLSAELFAWNPPADATEYKQPERPALLAAGTLAPDFTVEKWGGGDLKLSDYRGKVVIVDFWATWCGPCQQSMPHIEQVYKKTKDKNVVTLGVCVWDEKKAYEDWMPKNLSKYTFLFGFDPAGRGAENVAQKLYKVSGIPTTYVIDKEGKVAAAIVGFSPGDTRLEEALAKLGVDVPKAGAEK